MFEVCKKILAIIAKSVHHNGFTELIRLHQIICDNFSMIHSTVVFSSFSLFLKARSFYSVGGDGVYWKSPETKRFSKFFEMHNEDRRSFL